MTRAAAILASFAASLCLIPGMAVAQEPAGYLSPFNDTLSTRVFPLFAMMRTADGWAETLREDTALQRLVTERAGRVSQYGCVPSAQCLADAWVWTDADIMLVEARLKLLMMKPNLVKSLVTRQMRPSGRYAAHAALTDPDLVARAWTEAAAAVNRVVAVYAKGVSPRYPAIDSTIFDVAAPQMTEVIGSYGTAIASQAKGEDLFFDPALRYATGLLQMNERIDAGRFRPLLDGDNEDTAGAVSRTRWDEKPYTALLVFGHGPEDAQSRTGVMGHIRLNIAADLYLRGLAPFIIVSGGNVHPNRTPFNEAVEMKHLLVTQYGISAGRILIEPHARHTTTNLRNCARLLLAAGFPADRQALIVSDDHTIHYIGGEELAARNMREMGVQPGRLEPGPNRFSLGFMPDAVAFHTEPADPLDP